MRVVIPRQEIIESLVLLAPKVMNEGIPESVIQQAIEENPWYTRFYIEHSLKAILGWFGEEKLTQFLEKYPERNDGGKEVGVITAGNLPLVGFHDVLISILSGNRVLVKPSHRDQVLMRWFIGLWQEILPELKDRITFGKIPGSIDFLITTGSNNTARYIEAGYRHTPKILRKNRFSVAILGPETKAEEIIALCDDILLYNGLGCRNVSNLLVLPGFDWDIFMKKVSVYPTERLNPLYLERVLYQKSLMEVLDKPFQPGKNLIIEPTENLGISSMGIVRAIEVKDEATLLSTLKHNQLDIQCIVGQETAFGMTQQPELSNFADNLDTMEILTGI
jgi:hypothetical protein